MRASRANAPPTRAAPSPPVRGKQAPAARRRSRPRQLHARGWGPIARLLAPTTAAFGAGAASADPCSSVIQTKWGIQAGLQLRRKEPLEIGVFSGPLHKDARRAGRSSPLREFAAPVGSDRLLTARDERGMETAGGRFSLLAPKKIPDCREFTGATGLEPATSGVTGFFHRNDD